MGKLVIGFIIGIIVFSADTFAQNVPVKPVIEITAKGDTIYKVVETMPIYKGGNQDIISYIQTLKYPETATKNGWEGTAYIEFIIDNSGNVVNANVAGSSGYEVLDTAALELIMAMGVWKPGTQNKVPVNVKFVIPIKFKL